MPSTATWVVPSAFAVAALLAIRVAAGAPDAKSPDGGFGVFLPGTQPLELTEPLRSPDVCDACHGDFASYAANDTWEGTMMANAARDPLFQAALAVANQDEPGSGDFCLRCHTPRGWLAGRSEPPRIATLEPSDFESVDCDFCHRLTPADDGSSHVGNGQYLVADDFVRRGPIGDSLAPHEWAYSGYHEESRLCGLCHDVSNPLRDGFPIERTYTEWLSSDFAREGMTCQRCHLPAETGPVCGAPNMPNRTAHRHDFAGGNYWMPLVLAGEFPELGREDAYHRTADNAGAQLERAAALSIRAAERVRKGADLTFAVRVENLTGHKLPTGYPEGRRAWLEVTVADSTGRELLHSGAYDSARSERLADAQLRTYEVRMAAGGVEGFHFILQDEILEDSRIPPRGFVVRDDTRPIGRHYPVVGTSDAGAILAHWDEAPYRVTIDGDVAGPLSVCASLWYQTTSAEYVRALRDANVSDDAGKRMHALWERYERAPPFRMASSCITRFLDSADASAPDTGPGLDSGGLDSGARPDGSTLLDASADAPLEAGTPRVSTRGSGGCGCRSATRLQSDRVDSAWMVLFGLFSARRKKRHGKE